MDGAGRAGMGDVVGGGGVGEGGQGLGEWGAYGPPLSEPCCWSQPHRRRDCFHTQAAIATKRSSNAIMFGCGGC